MKWPLIFCRCVPIVCQIQVALSPACTAQPIFADDDRDHRPPLHRHARARRPLDPLGVFAAVRLPLLVREDFWYDEVFTYTLASGTWWDVLVLAARDQTNPPGFYLLAKAWMMLGGESDAWLRLLPCMLGIAVGPVVLGILRSLGTSWRGQVAGVALAAASPMLVQMSVEFRGYSALALGSAAVIYLAATLLLDEDPPSLRRWLTLLVTGWVLVMFHYYGALTLLAVVAAALWHGRHRVRFVLFAGIGPLLAFIPWLIAVVSNMRTSGEFAPTVGWIERPTLSDLPTLVLSFVGNGGWWILRHSGPLIAVTALLIALTTATGHLRHATGQASRAPTAGRLLFPAVVLPIVVALVASWVLPRPIWVPRYLIGVAVPFCVLIGWTIERRPRIATVGSTVALGWVLLGSLPDAYRPIPYKLEWSRIARELGGRGGSDGANVTVYALEGFISLPLTYHASRQRLPVKVTGTFQRPQESARSFLVYRSPPTADSVIQQAATLAGAHLGPPLHQSPKDSSIVTRRVSWPGPAESRP